MAQGVKTNERPGTRASLRYARFSPYKAREVLDLIRGLPVTEARDVLVLTERGAADHILKLLDSAVANAVNNDGIAGEELYVSACFADEGPTLKRFRPRARGRAGRIRKRTTHVTLIVSRLSASEIATRREREESRGGGRSAAASRAARVAKSRQRSGQDVDEPDTSADDESVEENESAEGSAVDATVDTDAYDGGGDDPAVEEDTGDQDSDSEGDN